MLAYEWVPYDWLIRCALITSLILTFALLLLRPLWKLTKSRSALIIVFSRAMANFLRLVDDFPTFVVDSILVLPRSPGYSVFIFVMNSSQSCLETALHTHNLALAANRMHALCFPFHYNMFYAGGKKKWKIYLLCLLLWLLAVCLGVSDPIVRKLPGGFSPVTLANQIFMAAAGLLYAVLGCRLLWMKYFNNSLVEASNEKDSVRILVTCMACLLMSTLRLVVMNRLASYAMANWGDVPNWMVYWASYLTYLLSLCTEEILLAMLVADFRQNVRRQFRLVFCCKSVNEDDNTKITILHSNPIIVKPNNTNRNN